MYSTPSSPRRTPRLMLFLMPRLPNCTVRIGRSAPSSSTSQSGRTETPRPAATSCNIRSVVSAVLWRLGRHWAGVKNCVKMSRRSMLTGTVISSSSTRSWGGEGPCRYPFGMADISKQHFTVWRAIRTIPLRAHACQKHIAVSRTQPTESQMIVDQIRSALDTYLAIRREIHANPELGFDEHRTVKPCALQRREPYDAGSGQWPD
ncbi:hypothetical protein PTE30175_04202 [Pandoraea terrae]|uniref:Amidohydrolase n=1 Tax=Pandoraea terrae TaxID=1537710 RepID=A0A5E4Y698_9BURK|nr:hypothetical protein PTE30175_04202 [Pandoraea terrae]